MTKDGPSLQHTPKAKLRFDFLWAVANAKIEANGKVSPPPPSLAAISEIPRLPSSCSTSSCLRLENEARSSLTDEGMKSFGQARTHINVAYSCRRLRRIQVTTPKAVVDVQHLAVNFLDLGAQTSPIAQEFAQKRGARE